MWFLVTMNRPDRCQKSLDSMVKSGITTTGIVIVNGPQRIDEYRRLRLPKDWKIVELYENIGICGGLNHAFRTFPNEPWYGLVCDDELVFTPGFDQKIISAAGMWGIAHGNDGWRASYRLWTYVVYPGNLLRTVGYWAPPGLWHWFFDDMWETIAAEFNLKRFCKDVNTSHEHVDNGKATYDETYRIGQSRTLQDKERFERWKLEEWREIRNRLRLEMSQNHGPEPVGTMLSEIFTKCGIVKPADCPCIEWIKKMDEWGVSGCNKHRPEIIQRLNEAAMPGSWLDFKKVAEAATNALKVAAAGYGSAESLLDAAIEMSRSHWPG